MDIIDPDEESDEDIFIDDDGGGSDIFDDDADGSAIDDDNDNDNDGNNAMDDVDAVCSRFLEAWMRNEPPAILLGISDEYAGSSGHLLLHPCDPISRSVFSASGGEGQRDVDRHSQRMDFFRALLNSRPSVRLLQSPESGVTLLHVALYRNSSLNLIQLLTCQGVTSLQDSSGRTPLYLACHRSQPGVKQYLLELDRAAAQIGELEGQVPLHLACQHDPMDPFVDELIGAYPEGLAHRHTKGVTPVLGAFWHHEVDHATNRSEGKLERLIGWVTQHPESIRTFNRSNLETALACACRQVYSASHPDWVDEHNLHLCRTLIREFPVALAMTVAMTLPAQRHVSLPYPLQIARAYGRDGRLDHTLVLATLQLLRAFVELVLHPTFAQSGAYGRLRRHAGEVVERHFPSNCGDSTSRNSPSGMVVSRQLVMVVELVVDSPDWELAPYPPHQLPVWFPEAMCTELFRNYDARSLLKSDGTFRDALNALFWMNDQAFLPSGRRPGVIPGTITLECFVTRLSNANGDLTALFLGVLEFLPVLTLTAQSSNE